MNTVQPYSNEPLAESLNAFLRCLEGKNRSELTRKAYHTDLLQFFIWLKENNSFATSPEKFQGRRDRIPNSLCPP